MHVIGVTFGVTFSLIMLLFGLNGVSPGAKKFIAYVTFCKYISLLLLILCDPLCMVLIAVPIPRTRDLTIFRVAFADSIAALHLRSVSMASRELRSRWLAWVPQFRIQILTIFTRSNLHTILDLTAAAFLHRLCSLYPLQVPDSIFFHSCFDNLFAALISAQSFHFFTFYFFASSDTCTGYADFGKVLIEANPNLQILHKCRLRIPSERLMITTRSFTGCDLTRPSDAQISVHHGCGAEKPEGKEYSFTFRLCPKCRLLMQTACRIKFHSQSEPPDFAGPGKQHAWPLTGLSVQLPL